MRRHELLVAAGLSLAVAGLAVPGAGAGAATHARDSVPKSTALTGGTSPLLSQYQVLGASSAGVLLATYGEAGNSDLSGPGGGNGYWLQDFSVLKTGQTMPVKLPLDVANYPAVQIVGDHVVTQVFGFSSDEVWSENLTTGWTGTRSGSADSSFVSATPDGFLAIAPQGEKSLLQLTPYGPGSTSTIADLPTDAALGPWTPGPDGVAVGTYAPASKKFGEMYFPYNGAPVRVLDQIESKALDCSAITSGTLGCSQWSTRGWQVVRYSLSSDQTTVIATTSSETSVWLTTDDTVWRALDDADAPFFGVITSTGSAGGSVQEFEVGAGPYSQVTTVATDGQYLFVAARVTRTNPGGIYELPLDFGSSSRPQLATYSRSSRVAAAACAVGGGSVAWIDNNHAGLGVWSRGLVENASGGLSIGPATYRASLGWQRADRIGYLQVATTGSAFDFTGYNSPSASTSPLSIWSRSGSTSHRWSDAASWGSTAQDGLGASLASVSVSGPWILYATVSGAQLANSSTGQIITLPTGNIAQYALGSGKLVWLENNGSVWQEPVGITKATRLARGLTGATLGGQGGDLVALAVAGNYVAWAFSYITNNDGTGYTGELMDLSDPSRDVAIPDPALIYSLTLSRDYLGLVTDSDLYGSDIYVHELSAGGIGEQLVASNSTGLSISGDEACWIGIGSQLPYVARL